MSTESKRPQVTAKELHGQAGLVRKSILRLLHLFEQGDRWEPATRKQIKLVDAAAAIARAIEHTLPPQNFRAARDQIDLAIRTLREIQVETPQREKRTLCICGLDHGEPLPRRFDAPPIVLASFGGSDGGPSWNCHVCHASWTVHTPAHKRNCAYAKSLPKGR